MSRREKYRSVGEGLWHVDGRTPFKPTWEAARRRAKLRVADVCAESHVSPGRYARIEAFEVLPSEREMKTLLRVLRFKPYELAHIYRWYALQHMPAWLADHVFVCSRPPVSYLRLAVAELVDDPREVDRVVGVLRRKLTAVDREME